jgi:hypothetical protein
MKYLFTSLLLLVFLLPFKAQQISDPICKTEWLFDDDSQSFVKKSDVLYEYDHKGRLIREATMIQDSRAQGGAYLNNERLLEYDKDDNETFKRYRQYTYDLDVQKEPIQYFESKEIIKYDNDKLLYYESTQGEHIGEEINNSFGLRITYTREGECRTQREVLQLVTDNQTGDQEWKIQQMRYYSRNENCDIVQEIREYYNTNGIVQSSTRTDNLYEGDRLIKTSSYFLSQFDKWELACIIDKSYITIGQEVLLTREETREMRDENLEISNIKELIYNGGVSPIEVLTETNTKINYQGEISYTLKEYYQLNSDSKTGYKISARDLETEPWLLLEEESYTYSNGQIIQELDYTYSPTPGNPKDYYSRSITTDLIYDNDFLTTRSVFYYSENNYEDILELFEIEYDEKYTPRCDGKVDEYELLYHKYQDPCNPSNAFIPPVVKYSYQYGYFDPCNPGTEEISFKVFPNPTTDVINIESELLSDYNAVIRLIDPSGRDIIGSIERRGHSAIINLANVQEGLYFVAIEKDDQQYTQAIYISQ